MRSQIYLVLIRDGSLALTIGAGLENRLLRDGYNAMALVPAVRGPGFADADYLRHLAIWRSGSEPVDHAPQVVALYEDGLLTDLESLGLPAYVGVRHGEEPRVARWANDSGAIMLPVATARDLVNAVADHTPWSRYAADLPSARYPVGAKVMPLVRRSRQSGHSGPSARSRRVVAVASVAAGPLLLAGLPSAAIAADGVSQAPALAATASGATAPVLAADIQQAPPVAAPANTGTTNTWGDFLTNPGTENYANATVTGAGAGNFPLSPAGDAFSNAFLNYVTQSAPGNSAFWNAFLGSGYIDIGASTSPNYGCLVELVVGPTCPLPGTAAAPGTGPDRSAAGSANHLAPSLTTSPTGGSAQQAGITANSASSGGTIGGFPSWTTAAAASGVQPGRTPAKAGAGGGLEAASPSSRPSIPASGGTTQSGSAKASPPAQTRKVAAGGGGGGGGGIPHSNFAGAPTSEPIHSTPIPHLNPGTPVTTVPKAPGLNQVGNTDLKTSLPYGAGVGDYYNPDGSDAPDGSGNSVLTASADTGSSATDGSGNSSPAGGGGSPDGGGGAPADDPGGSQNGAVMLADNSGGLGGGGLPAGGGIPTAGGDSAAGGNTVAAIAAPVATPIPSIGNDQPPTSIGGSTSVFASAGGLMNGGDAGLEGGGGDGGDGSGGGMMTG